MISSLGIILIKFFKSKKKEPKRPTFKEWKLDVQRLLFEQGHPPFYIAHVDDCSDHWLWLYDIEYTAQEAIDDALDDVFSSGED